MVAVTGERRQVAGRVARWALLVCTLFGLAAMHTLGHAGMRMDAHPGHGPAGAAVAMDVPVNGAAAQTALADDCPGCPHASGPHAPGRGGVPGWTVCLAVLGGLAVLVLLAALPWARLRRFGLPASAATARPPVPRGPPRSAGLILARLSVLRR